MKQVKQGYSNIFSPEAPLRKVPGVNAMREHRDYRPLSNFADAVIPLHKINEKKMDKLLLNRKINHGGT